MGREVDSRVVEMRFDNKEFERNAKTSMTTLGKLKQALNLPNSGKAFEEISKSAKNVKLDGLLSGIQALEQRFSTMGIVGMRVIENLTDGLMSKLGSAINFVTDSIVSGGIKRAMNIENAHFQLQALLKDEAKVQAVMADAMESVDGTAYAYDEAAKAASQFAASGIQAGEEMLGALKGITGVAAMTNSSFEDISRIFTTVAGNGRLMGDQLLQLSGRGLNAASTMVDYYKEVRNQANITEAEVRDMVSKGKVSFKDFSDAMTWAFGESAKRANETLTGAFSNMKSALARIGAGFISPLVEQNGELVNTLNALRIQINNVKSALVFDEQQSAVSGLSKQITILDEEVGKLGQSGEISFDKFTNAIIGNSRSEEELLETNNRLSETFETMKEKGYATSDMLKVFQEEGMNFSYGLVKYLNGVQEGSIKASNAMTKAVKEVTGGTRVTVQEIDKLVKDGKISIDIFSATMANTAKEMTQDANFASEAVTAMFKKVKNEGHLTSETLKEFERSNVGASKALMNYINGVKDGTIRASYATKKAIDEMTDSALNTTHEINKFVDEGKISFDIFQSAMEEAYGDSRALSKQFTDSFLDSIKKVREAIENADLTKPMEGFYYWVEISKNLGKGLLSVLKPIGKAFGNVFSSINVDTMVELSASIEELTSKMQLSESNSQNLQDAMEGLFNVAKLLFDIFFDLLGIFVPMNKPVLELGDGFFGLAGSAGRALTALTKSVRSSQKVKKAYEFIKNAVSDASSEFSALISRIRDFIKECKNIPNLQSGFRKLSDSIGSLTVSRADLKRFTEKVRDLGTVLKDVDWKNPGESLEKLAEKIKGLLDTAMRNEGFATFVKNLKEFGFNVEEAFSFENILKKIETFKEKFGSFVEWLKTYVFPVFSDFGIGDAISGAAGFGLIYALIKAAKSFETVSKIMGSIPTLLGNVSKTLIAYQRDLNASAILKIAGAIFVLAAALTILSFADTERLLQAGFAFAIFAGILMYGASEMMNAIGELKKAFTKGKPVEQALNTFASGLKNALKNLGKAVKIKAIGSAIKDVAISLAIIVASIVTLGYMYRKDKEALDAGVNLVQYLLIVITGIMVAMTMMGEVLQKGTKGFATASAGMLMIAGTLVVILYAMNKLFKMKLPPEEELSKKLGILAMLFGGLSVLAIAVGAAGRIAGGQKISGSSFIGMASLIYLTVVSLKKLFEMKIPDDLGKRLGILAGIFIALGALMVAIGYASKLSGGNSLKALGTLVGVCMFLAVAVGALVVLSIFPSEKILKGALAFGAILVALGAALYGAGKITDKDTYKTVLSMAIGVGAIVVALAVLSMIKPEKLLKATLSLGAVLLALGAALYGAGKAAGSDSTIIVLSMVMGIISIAIALYQLADKPWQSLLSAGVAISAVLLVFGKVFEQVLKPNWSKYNVNKMGIFLLMTTALIPIGYELGKLANYPWQNMISAASSVSLVLLAMSKSFQLVLEKNWSDNNVKKIATFVLMCSSLFLIGPAIGGLANYPWEGLIAAGLALSSVVLAMGVVFKMISGIKEVNIGTIVAFVAATVALYPIATAVGELAKHPWENLLASAIALSAVLLALTVSVAILGNLGVDPGSAAQAALALDAFVVVVGALMVALGGLFTYVDGLEGMLDKGIDILIKIGNGLGQFVGAIIGGIGEGVTASLPVMADNLSLMMTNLQPFIQQAGLIDDSVLKGVGYLSAAIVLLTAAEMVSAVGLIMGGGLGLANMALEMQVFAKNLQPFLQSMEGVKPEVVEACKNIAAMLIAITAAELINGIGRFLRITGGIGSFGKELEKFGQHMAVFGDYVKGVKPEAVQGAAASAEIMAELANKLPPQEGLAQKIFGTRSLEDFGKELVPFGIQLKIFSIIVKDIKPEAVVGAACAGQIMSTLANGLPESESLKSKIFGGVNMTLSEFGKELIKFATQLRIFSAIAQSITPEGLQGTVTLTKIMTTLSEKLPERDGLFDKILGNGQMTFEEFGKQLVAFGKQMRVFSNLASTFDLSAVINVVEGFKLLVELSENLASADASGLVEFSNQLASIGSSGVDNFIAAFTNANGLISTNMSAFVTNVYDALSTSLVEQQPTARESITVLCSAILNQFELDLSTENVKPIGSDTIRDLTAGMISQRGYILGTVKNLCAAVIKAFRDEMGRNKTFPIGQEAAMGLKDGIESKIGEIADAAIKAAKQAISSARQALDSHSPSREFFSIGEDVDLGMAYGILSMLSIIGNAGEKMAEEAINPVKDVSSRINDILEENGDLDFQPVIVPIIDTSEVKRGADQISDLFSNYTIDVSEINRNLREAANVFDTTTGKAKETKTKEEKSTIINNHYNMEQNNYSPKALSRSEIYRDTDNLFSLLERKVGAKK